VGDACLVRLTIPSVGLALELVFLRRAQPPDTY
jgi:hypothetical protein